MGASRGLARAEKSEAKGNEIIFHFMGVREEIDVHRFRLRLHGKRFEPLPQSAERPEKIMMVGECIKRDSFHNEPPGWI